MIALVVTYTAYGLKLDGYNHAFAESYLILYTEFYSAQTLENPVLIYHPGPLDEVSL